MALNSINTNIGAYYAQQNIGRASSMASLSVARLSSGNRIIRASDDVAALAAGTSLRTAVTTLRTALINTAQGSSLLQVADGALSQIVDILQRQKAIAIQAGSGTLAAEERGFLNQEFQQLSQEINRLTDTTNFNGVVLLDGSVFDKTTANTASTTAGQATASIQFINVQTAKTLVFNGVTFTGTTAAAGVTGNFYLSPGNTDINSMIDSLVTTLNSSTNTNVSGAIYSRAGSSLVVTQRAGIGAIGRTFTFETGTAGATYGGVNVGVTGLVTSTANRFFLQGGNEVGLGFGRTFGTGVVGDNLVVTQNQVVGSQQITFVPAAAGVFTASYLSKTIAIGGATGFTTVSFMFTTSIVNTTDILIGASVEETLDNAVQAMRTFSGLATTSNDARFVMDQLEFSREGRQITIERDGVGNVNVANNTAVFLGTNVTGAGPAFGAGSLANAGVQTGINTQGVTNAAFTGTISGFAGTFTGTTNRINLTLSVGGITYSANNVDTNVGANTTVRFLSTAGGYFDVDFAASQGASVADQAGANQIAARLDAAFAGLNFYQKRDITSYVGAGSILTDGVVTGTLTGTSVRIQLDDFSDVNLEDISVAAPAPGTTNGIVEFVINGETFRSGDIGSTFSVNGKYKLTSLSNANHYIEFFGPSSTSNNPALATDISFSTTDRATALESALKAAFGVGEGGAALDFQVGTSIEDTISVTIGNAQTEKLYGGQSIDVLTQASATIASQVIDDALDAATSIRADVGAFQSRFVFATYNIESSLQNQDAARGVLLDTDIAAESTAYATAQVQLQAGIAVLAQANLLPQNLLKLIG